MSKKNKMTALDYVAYILVTVGAINWGLVGAFNFNLVNYLLGSVPLVEKIVYIAVGACGLYSLYTLIKLSRK